MTTVARRKLGLTHYDNRTAGGYTLFAPQTGGVPYAVSDAPRGND